MDKSERGMDGSMGMSPRKAMASSLIKGGDNFGVGGVGKSEMHPDASSHMGRKPEMKDGARGIGDSVKYAKGNMPAQAAPDHGAHDPGGMEKSWKREGKA